MTASPSRARDGVATRLGRGWTAWYTSGLPTEARATRRAEIDSDLAEHHEARLGDGWTDRRIAREQLTRLARGAPADLAWRHDVLAPTYRATGVVRGVVLTVTTLASLALAAFYLSFAAFVNGSSSLSARRFLGGLDSYAEEVGTRGGSIAAAAFTGLALVLVVSALARPVSPMLANVLTISASFLLVGWFWLGMAPLGIVAIAGAAIDLSLRAPATRPPHEA